MHMETRDETALIPSPAVVRAELARSVREARRLRSLLRLAVRAEEDRRFVRALFEEPDRPRQAAPGQGGRP
jgi:hypothetical protein